MGSSGTAGSGANGHGATARHAKADAREQCRSADGLWRHHFGIA